MQRFVESRWFALFVLCLVLASGVGLYLSPQSRSWVLILLVVMSMLRLVLRPASFQTPAWAAILLVFLLTAGMGYAVSYNETRAWNRFCLLVIAVLLYVNVAAQPVQNSKVLAWLGVLTGFGVASCFLLTTDFTALAVKVPWIHQVGVAWMSVRPDVFQLPSIHPNDAAGISIIAGAYGLPLLYSRRTASVQRLIILVALGVILIAFVLASSRGAFLGLIGALAIWTSWRLLPMLPPALKKNSASWFPYLISAGIVALELLVLFIPSKFLGSSFSVNENVLISRAEVFRSGLTILQDFPFTGGGLGSFPGLYSNYVLAMPFYLLPHSHNMILNVMIEQGLLGGMAFVLIYLMAVRKLLSSPKSPSGQFWYLAACISLFTALFHGMVDDYLYETSGPVLALIPAGMAVLASRREQSQASFVTSDERVPHGLLLTSPQYAAIGVSLAVALFAVVWRPAVAQWHANLGAIEMAKIELADFPTGKWRESNDVSSLRLAEIDFERALAYQSTNQTANYRLGLIKMSANDYEAASRFLQKAYETNSTDRGVIKNLGYSYLWSGETEKALSLLSRIPEAKHELEQYVWWWDAHQRPDLSERAAQLAARLVAQP